MIIEPIPWMASREICPADFELSEYLQNKPTLRIFHMGPGYDHILARNTTNPILAITHCPGELSSYMSLAIHDNALAQRYQVLFGDIYFLDRIMFGYFDIVTLFHLGELQAYYEDWDLVIGKFTCPIILYRGTKFYSKLHEKVLYTGRQVSEEYKSLVVYV